MTPHKLGQNYVHDLLHDALTSRIKGTNRHFTHLIRTRSGEWCLVRENHLGIAYFEDKNDYVITGQYAILRVEEGNVIPLAFTLSDYRPTKLGTMKIGDREIPSVSGGGSIFTFIEDWIDQTYNWYVEHDIDRPDYDMTHAYDLELGSNMAAQRPVESVETVEEPESATDAPEVEEDPFGALYRRKPEERKKQWSNSINHSFPEAVEQAKKDDPIKFDMYEEDELKKYLSDMVLGEVDQNEIKMLVRMCRSLDSKYTMIRRNPNGYIIAKSDPETMGIIIYANPESHICIPNNPTVAFKLKPEFLRFK